MNNNRRKAIRKLIEELARALDENQIETLRGNVEDVKSEEEEYRDNMPENLRESERYQMADAACDALGEAVDGLQEIIDKISEINDKLEEATE